MKPGPQTPKRKLQEDPTELLENKKLHHETFLSGMSNIAESTNIRDLNVTDLVNNVIDSKL